MTKQRIALTFPQAMTIVAGFIGYDRAAAIADRAERTIYEWANPQGTARPSVETAVAFDAAYAAAGGEDTPFLDAFAHQLDVVVASATACQRALAHEIADAARESGDAIAASIVVTASNASPSEIYRALAETEQAQSKFAALMRRLTSFLPFGAGPDAGKSGGSTQ